MRFVKRLANYIKYVLNKKNREREENETRQEERREFVSIPTSFQTHLGLSKGHITYSYQLTSFLEIYIFGLG